MKKGKLLMLSTDRAIFDPKSAVFARQSHYAREWDEVHIIIFAKKGQVPDEMVVAPNCWAYSTRSFSKFLYPFDAGRLGRFVIAKRGITEITCQDSSLTAMAGLSLKRQFGLPLEIQIHEDIGSPHYVRSLTNRIRKSLALSHLPKADKIRVVSARIAKYLESIGIDRSKITVKPIEVDVQRIKNTIVSVPLKQRYPQFSNIVLMASRIEKEKDISLAIEAWPAVIKEIPKAGLLIVGRGSDQSRLESLVKNFGISSSVIFVPWLDQDNLATFYKSADLFLNTSWFEGYGMTLVEAEAAGCPIISTDVGVAREVGATIVGHAAQELAAAIIHALKSK